MRRHQLLAAAALILGLVMAACGGSGGSAAPTAPTTPVQPTVNYVVSGTVTAADASGLAGALVSVADGPNAGRSTTTDGSGAYSLSLPSGGGFTVTISANGYLSQAKGITLTPSSPTGSFSARLLPARIWTASGTGDTVFDMPTYITRVKITGDYTSYSSNFIVHIGSAHVVNELVGTGWGQTHFEGTYVTTGGVVQILSSSGVRWTFTEVR